MAKGATKQMPLVKSKGAERNPEGGMARRTEQEKKVHQGSANHSAPKEHEEAQ